MNISAVNYRYQPYQPYRPVEHKAQYVPNTNIINVGNFAALSPLHFTSRVININDNSYSFKNFDKARKEAGLTTLKAFERNIKEENLLGEGLESTVYEFDDPKLSKWALKVMKEDFNKVPPRSLVTEKEDPFPGKNRGQIIASVGCRYYILKKIDGEPHSVTNWKEHIDNESHVTQEETQEFAKSLEKIASFPQRSFDNYAHQLKALDENGYKQDSMNPNNLLIDYTNKKISIIDYFKKDNEWHKNSKYDLINSILDFSLFEAFYNTANEADKSSMLKSSKKIIEKCTKAAIKDGISLDIYDYIGFLTEVDKWFGYKIIQEEEGDHRARFYHMSKILKDNGISIKSE